MVASTKSHLERISENYKVNNREKHLASNGYSLVCWHKCAKFKIEMQPRTPRWPSSTGETVVVIERRNAHGIQSVDGWSRFPKGIESSLVDGGSAKSPIDHGGLGGSLEATPNGD